MTTEIARCTGGCCEAFPLHLPPNDLAEAAPRFQDGATIGDMVIFIGTLDKWPTDGRPTSDGEAWHFYTCRHFDTMTRNCAIYDRRPVMCSDYPYGRPCTIPGCTRREAEPKLVQIAKRG